MTGANFAPRGASPPQAVDRPTRERDIDSEPRASDDTEAGTHHTYLAATKLNCGSPGASRPVVSTTDGTTSQTRAGQQRMRRKDACCPSGSFRHI